MKITKGLKNRKERLEDLNLKKMSLKKTLWKIDLAEELTLRVSRGFFTALASLNDASSTCSFAVCCLREDLVDFFLNGEGSSEEEILSCLDTLRFMLGLDPVLTSLRDEFRLSPKLFLTDSLLSLSSEVCLLLLLIG